LPSISPEKSGGNRNHADSGVLKPKLFVFRSQFSALSVLFCPRFIARLTENQ
jgi:hypothetical protein